MPSVSGRGFRILLARIGHANRGLRLGRMLEEGRLHLLRQQFLIDQAVEDSLALVISELPEWAAVQQGLVTESLVPVTLQDDVAVDRGHDAIDHVAGAGGGRRQHSQEQADREHRNRHEICTNPTHQNGWPMLKNMLKCRRRCDTTLVAGSPNIGFVVGIVSK